MPGGRLTQQERQQIALGLADGLAYVEAYPPKEASSDARAYHGPLSLYLGAGFEQVRDLDRYVMVRRTL